MDENDNLDKNVTDKVVELNDQQTEQVVGGKRFAGQTDRLETINNNLEIGTLRDGVRPAAQ